MPFGANATLRFFCEEITNNCWRGLPVDYDSIVELVRTKIEKVTGTEKADGSWMSSYYWLAKTLHFSRELIPACRLVEWDDFVRCHYQPYMLLNPIKDPNRHGPAETKNWKATKEYETFQKLYKEYKHLYTPERFKELVEIITNSQRDGHVYDDGDFSSVRTPHYQWINTLEWLTETCADKRWAGLRVLLPARFRAIQRKSNYNGKPVKSVKSCLIWAGCRQRQANDIVPKICTNLQKESVFLDAFCGMATVAMIVKLNRPDVSIWLNDASPNVYAFLMTLKDQPDYLIQKYKEDRACCDRWEDYKHSLSGDLRSEERAWRFWYVISYSWGQSARGFHLNQKASGLPKDAQIRCFRKNSDLLQGAKITNIDWQDAAQQCWKKDFLFFDPPYRQRHNAPTLYHPFKVKDHNRLRDFVHKCDKQWMVCYDDSPENRSNYAGYILATMARRNKTDLIITPGRRAMAKKATLPANEVSASGEAKNLIREWHQAGKGLEKQALIEELKTRFPSVPEEKWDSGVSNAKSQLRAANEIPAERHPRSVGGKRTSPGDELTVMELELIGSKAKENGGLNALIEMVAQLDDLAHQVGGINKLRAGLSRLEKMREMIC